MGGHQASVTDVLLLDVARKVQLAPTNYRLAVERYGAINAWLDRSGSPLRGKIQLLYPQGSMVMGTTISSRLENDEFDIDVMAELLGEFASWHPRDILDLFYAVLNGEPGSRYHGKVDRMTRCVQVQYEGMHLDVTPSTLISGRVARVSQIFHSKQERPRHEDRRIVANPWGFAEWFKEQMPLALGESTGVSTLAKASEAVPVEEQPELHERSLPVIAMQLIKRWRNKKYDQRSGRCPPSVLMACLVGERSGQRLAASTFHPSLHTVLLDLVIYLLKEFDRAERDGVLIHRVNPACPHDEILTDRWPGNMTDQRQFITDLQDFRNKLELLGRPDLALPARNELLSDMFGERAAALAMEELRKRLDERARSGDIFHRLGTGSILAAPALGVGIAASSSAATIRQAPRSTSYGSD
jgi:hypothetical protein